MKITNYGILFLILCSATYFILFLNSHALHNTELERVKYNNALDGATRDGLEKLVEYDDGQVVAVNKDLAVENFFMSLYSHLGCMDNTLAQDKLKLYIPVVLVTDKDGFYVYHNYRAETSSGTYLIQDWTEKLPYVYEYEGHVFNFTMGNDVSILDKDTQEVLHGDYHDLAHFYPDIPFLHDEDEYEQLRRNAIITQLTNSMQYYVNMHNRLAEEYGISYHFYVPSISSEDWNRTIDHISMMVIFQGYPYRSAKGYFNRMEVAAARLEKSMVYYIETQLDGTTVYHEEDCPYVVHREHPYESAKECAQIGAYPCEYCEP